MSKSRDLEGRDVCSTELSDPSSFRTCQRRKYHLPFWQIGSRNSLNPGGIPFTVLQEYPSSGSRKGKERSWLSSSWIARPSPWIRLSDEAFAAATTASIRSCRDDGRIFFIWMCSGGPRIAIHRAQLLRGGSGVRCLHRGIHPAARATAVNLAWNKYSGCPSHLSWNTYSWSTVWLPKTNEIMCN